MASGVQCWNASGQKTLDLTTRVAKFFGTASIGNSYTGTATSGTITDSRFTAYSGLTPFAFIVAGGIDFDGNRAVFSFSGNVLTWTFPNGSGNSYTRPDTTFIYGAI